MYIDSISLENVRTFAAEKTITFVHPDKGYDESSKAPKPRLDNVNLLFGENASGKTTLLESIALASLGPAITESRIAPRPLVRFAPTKRRPSALEEQKSTVMVKFAEVTMRAHSAQLPRVIFLRSMSSE